MNSLIRALTKIALNKTTPFIFFLAGIIFYHFVFHTNTDDSSTNSTVIETVESKLSISDPLCIHLDGHLSDTDKQALQIAEKIIAKFEGLRLKQYLDRGVPTIGYGHHLTGSNTSIQIITKETADCLLKEDVRETINFIDAKITVPLNPNQIATLSSWIYNIGPGAASHSTLFQKLNEGNYLDVPSELNRWVHVGKHISPVLETRRQSEVKLWNTPYKNN